LGNGFKRMLSSPRAAPVGRFLVVAGLLGALACGRAPEPSAAPVPSAPTDADAPPPPVVTRKATSLLYSFVDATGRIHAVPTIDEVPDAVKPRVLVVDLAQSAADRQAHRFAYFVDLTTEHADGTFPVSVVSRYDASSPTAAAPSALPAVPPGSVVVYSAVWCGYCKKAKAWLADNGVPYVERDVERQPGAQAELAAKLKAAGVQGGGIPVLDVNGALVMGFDVRRLTELLKKDR
jgi:glutaredoxin